MRGGRPKGPSLPFEIDPALAEAVDEAEGNDDSDSDDFQKDLFPVSAQAHFLRTT